MKSESMLLVEIRLPKYLHRKLANRLKSRYNDVVRKILRHAKSNTTFVLLERSPKGWWLALRILREGEGKLHIIETVKYLDIPSRVLELSFKEEWKPEYSQVIEKELVEWGLENG